MNVSAQNAFLRILEEPPSHTIFILKTDTHLGLLPTILSRCVVLRPDHEIRPSKIITESFDSDVLEMVESFISALEVGNTAIAQFMFELESLDREQLRSFLSLAQEELASKLRSSAAAMMVIPAKTIVLADKLLNDAKEFLERNVNIGHISGHICAGLIVN